MIRTLAATFFLCLCVTACGDDGGEVAPDAAGGANAVSDIATGSDATTDTAPDTTAGADSVTDAVTDSGAGADAATVTDTDFDSEPDTDTATGVVPATWCSRWLDARCAMMTRCSLSSPPSVAYDGPAECATLVRPLCPYDETLADAVTAGRIDFDADRAAECLDRLASATCDTIEESLALAPGGHAVAACEAALTPLVAPGGDCHHGLECADGAFCAYEDACPGTCVAPNEVGAACGIDDGPCAPGAALCLGGECAALPAEDGAPCLSGYCAAPLRCHPATDVCREPALAGEPCGPTAGVCASGLICFGDATAGGTCAPYRQAGESCFSSADCRGAAGEVLVCAGGTCDAAPGPGDPCFELTCDRTAWCETTAVPPTCRAFPAVDEPCDAMGRCGAGAWCDAGTCRARKSAGEPCAAESACAAYHRCFRGACVADGAVPCPEEAVSR